MAIFNPALAQPSVLDYLPGEQAGVWVSAGDGGWNSSRTILLRGTNSLHSASGPLWIVDGVETREYLSFLPSGKPSGIEVLKNISATALYGSKGANGVIIVTTEKTSEKDMGVTASSHAGVSIPVLTASGLEPAFLHNHTAALSGYSGHTYYSIGASYRRYNAVAGGGQQIGSGDFLLDSKAGSALRFGMHLLASVGELDDSPGSARVGEPSMMSILRTPDRFPGLDPLVWRNDHDDLTAFKRAMVSAHLNVQMLPSLEWMNNISGDLLSNNRRVWFGLDTPLGEENNGFASHTVSRLFHGNARSQFSFSHYYGSHRLELIAGAEFWADMQRFNRMEGTDFFSHELRADGLNLARSSPLIHIEGWTLNSSGLFAVMDYKWREKAGLNAGIRSDGGKFFPWAGAFADIRQLLPARRLSALSSMRMDAGWGIAGFEWIRSKEGNVSLASGLFKERLHISVTLYNKRTEDKLNRIQNKGVEFCIDAGIVSGENLNWKVEVIGAFNKNRLLEVDGGDCLGADIGHGLRPNANQVGQSAFAFLGRYNSIPEWTAGLGSELCWRRWSLEMRLDAAANYYVLDLNRLTGKQHLPWTVTEEYLDKGDYLRLKRLSISYKCTEHIKFNVLAWNLFTLSYRGGWNPAADSFAGLGLAPGIDYGTSPRYCSILGGIEYAF